MPSLTLRLFRRTEPTSGAARGMDLGSLSPTVSSYRHKKTHIKYPSLRLVVPFSKVHHEELLGIWPQIFTILQRLQKCLL